MSPGRRLPRSVRLLRRLYSLALLALPRPARRQLAVPMLGTFEAVCLRAHRRGGAWRSTLHGLLELADLLAAGARQRLGHDPLGGPGRRPPGARLRPLAELGTDLRSAFRSLTRRPTFAAIGILTLAAGIAAGTAVFSVVDSIILTPLPYRQPETLVRLMRVTDSGGFMSGWQGEQVAAWAGTDVFGAINPYRIEHETLIEGREPERIQVAYVLPSALEFLGVRPMVGRGFVAEDGDPAAEPVAVLEHGLARRRFGSAQAAVGQRLELASGTRRVVGVMPRGFHYPYQYTRAWIPRSLEALSTMGSVNVHARRPPDHAEPAVQARADALAATDDADRLVGVKLWPAGHVNTELREWVWILFGAAGLLVLIACANTANLILARGTRREREISVRSALGAGRSRLVRQSLLESLMMATAGGGTGALIAAGLLPWLLRLAPDAITGYTANAVDLDGRALGFAIGLSLLTSVLFGLVPALRGTRVDLARVLAGSRGTEAASGGGRLRGGIVVGEVALTLVLLLGAGLLLSSFARLLAVDMGLELDRVVAVDLAMAEESYPTLESQLQLVDRIVDDLQALAGVETAAYGLGVPPGVGYLAFGPALETEAGVVPGTDDNLILPWASVSPEYFAALGIPVLQGRALEPGAGEDAVVLGASMAEALWPDRPAVGRRFRTGPDEPWLSVVGVVGEVKTNGPAEPFGPMEMYRPFLGTRPHSMLTVVARSTGEPASLIPTLRDVVRAADPTLPIERIATGEERLADSLREPRFQLTLVGTFALLAALLAGFGIFGVVSYAVSQRRGEMGVRMALGASPRRIASLVVGSALRLTAIGVVLGVGLGWMLGRLLESIVFEIAPTDPMVFVAVSAATLALALAACLLPALRAARLDPAHTLRAE